VDGQAGGGGMVVGEMAGVWMTGSGSRGLDVLWGKGLYLL
jgi:hypothetical protein